MADAARLLPILGVILFAVPLLWITKAGDTKTGAVMVYLFVVWAFLVVVAGFLSRRLGPEEDTPEDREPKGEEREGVD